MWGDAVRSQWSLRSEGWDLCVCGVGGSNIVCVCGGSVISVILSSPYNIAYALTQKTIATISAYTSTPTHVSGASVNSLLSGLLLSMNHLLLILASLVLKPHPDDPRAQASDLHQVFLQQCIRTWVSAVHSAESLQLLL